LSEKVGKGGFNKSSDMHDPVADQKTSASPQGIEVAGLVQPCVGAAPKKNQEVK